MDHMTLAKMVASIKLPSTTELLQGSPNPRISCTTGIWLHAPVLFFFLSVWFSLCWMPNGIMGWGGRRLQAGLRGILYQTIVATPDFPGRSWFPLFHFSFGTLFHMMYILVSRKNWRASQPPRGQHQPAISRFRE